jgi:hypothetical protein
MLHRCQGNAGNGASRTARCPTQTEYISIDHMLPRNGLSHRPCNASLSLDAQ